MTAPGWTTCPACCGQTTAEGAPRPCPRCEDTGVVPVTRETAPTCRSCRITMQPGRALQTTMRTGEPDFPGDDTVVTMSAGGPGVLVPCWKCPQCGRSIQK